MNEIFSCTVVFNSQPAVAYLQGELDSYTAECLIAKLGPLIKSGRDVVVNLSGLSFVSTTGLVLLDRLALCVTGKGGSLCLADPSAVARRLLDLTGLSDRLMIQADGALPSV
jgi:anti-sigma B factor antagonist